MLDTDVHRVGLWGNERVLVISEIDRSVDTISVSISASAVEKRVTSYDALTKRSSFSKKKIWLLRTGPLWLRYRAMDVFPMNGSPEKPVNDVGERATTASTSYTALSSLHCIETRETTPGRQFLQLQVLALRRGHGPRQQCRCPRREDCCRGCAPPLSDDRSDSQDPLSWHL